jgi:hypothetical protein
MSQTYQQVTAEVVNAMQGIDYKKMDFQKYFFNLKQKDPDRFERLVFDENGLKPFSEDLESILLDLKISGQQDQLKK